MGIGFIIYFTKVFVYCRGPKHYMDMNMMILTTAKHPLADKIAKQRADSGDGAFVLGAFIIAIVHGPLIVFDFIRFSILINKCQKIQATQEKNGG